MNTTTSKMVVGIYVLLLIMTELLETFYANPKVLKKLTGEKEDYFISISYLSESNVFGNAEFTSTKIETLLTNEKSLKNATVEFIEKDSSFSSYVFKISDIKELEKNEETILKNIKNTLKTNWEKSKTEDDIDEVVWSATLSKGDPCVAKMTLLNKKEWNYVKLAVVSAFFLYAAVYVLFLSSKKGSTFKSILLFFTLLACLTASLEYVSKLFDILLMNESCINKIPKWYMGFFFSTYPVLKIIFISMILGGLILEKVNKNPQARFDMMNTGFNNFQYNGRGNYYQF